MKNVLYLKVFIVLMLMLIGCGTGGQDSSPEEDYNSGDDKNGEEDEQLSGVDALLNQLTFDVDVQAGEDSVKFDMKLIHEGEDDMTISFSSGQKFEVVVTDLESDEELYRFSEGMMFTQAIVMEDLSPGDELEFQDSWDYMKDGVRVDPSEYKVSVELIPYEVNEESIDDHPFKEEVTFEVPE
ncbi:BsuPI-related putative proteinase inhibitor [Alkalibacillus silvisoli]|uniref:Intracellular proteinase inhibitor BsuPI domain-containing protein n=1 Tax=Alkalibacillus silvisoli TaxID=392823 RepID=A0ABN0ZPN1_9BACI